MLNKDFTYRTRLHMQNKNLKKKLNMSYGLVNAKYLLNHQNISYVNYINIMLVKIFL